MTASTEKNEYHFEGVVLCGLRGDTILFRDPKHPSGGGEIQIDGLQQLLSIVIDQHLANARFGR